MLHSSYTGFDAEPSVRLLSDAIHHIRVYWTAVTRSRANAIAIGRHADFIR